MPTEWITIRGTVVPGYRVASQSSKDYPYGTIDQQKPFFKRLGLDLEQFYPGTINLSIAPLTFAVVQPEFTFRQVEWTDLHPPEDFSFSQCRLVYKGKTYQAYIYYPHPETKKRHFEDASILEILAEYIPSLNYGATVEVELQTAEIQVQSPD